MHACIDIASNITKLEIHGAERCPGRLVQARVCTVLRAGGVRVSTHSAHSHRIGLTGPAQGLCTWRRPGRLSPAQLCAVWRAGGVRVSMHIQHTVTSLG